MHLIRTQGIAHYYCAFSYLIRFTLHFYQLLFTGYLIL